MFERIREKESIWHYLKNTDKPVYIYGMGDGALKIISVLESLNIPINGIYASDGFVRGHSFYGFLVKTLSEVKSESKDFISLLAFAAQREPLLSTLHSLSEELELYAPDVPVVKTDDAIFDTDYLKAHEAELDFVFDKLADELSRQTMINVLNFKLSGKISYLKEIESDISEVYENIVKPSSTQRYVDLGAYNGDTVLEFLSYSGGAKNIYAFEPDKKNFARLQKNLAAHEITAECFNIGAWDREGTLYFQGGKGGRNSKLNCDGKLEVSVNSVDNILAGQSADIIKFDVEGAEMQALDGCKATISRHTPALMVSAYHKNEDLFALPMRILSLNPEYKLFLRHHPYIPAWETNYYAVFK